VGPPPPFPPAFYIIDGLSSGADAGGLYAFSVAPGSVGMPASPVFFQATIGSGPSQFFPGPPGPSIPPEAAGDIFVTPAAVFGIPAAAPPPVFAAAFTDEFFLGLNLGPGGPDNLNALTLRAPGGPGGFFYSLAAGGLGASGAMPAGILNGFGMWAPSFALSLDSGGLGTDDIDALLVQNFGALGFGPGDFVAFSLTPGSLTLALLGYAPGTGGGDLFVPDTAADADLLPDLFLPGAVFGLLPTDNLDAIDVVPEPSAAAFVLVGFAMLGRRFLRARQRV